MEEGGATTGSGDGVENVEGVAYLLRDHTTGR
jgi:hypothetical protein